LTVPNLPEDCSTFVAAIQCFVIGMTLALMNDDYMHG